MYSTQLRVLYMYVSHILRVWVYRCVCGGGGGEGGGRGGGGEGGHAHVLPLLGSSGVAKGGPGRARAQPILSGSSIARVVRS